jgi:CDP-glucose 4,6-dehydratase
MGARVFITGATGFIGSNLCHELSGKGVALGNVVALVRDVIPSKWLEEALSKTTLVRGEITDYALLKRILSQYEIEEVYHFAAQAIVKHAYKNPVEVFNTNVMGTAKLLEACRTTNVGKVFYMSTDKIYGNVENATIDTPLRATEPYSASKIAADLLCQSYIQTYGMNIIIGRSCNVYGFDFNNRITSNTIRACLKGKSPVIYRDYGAKRQYIYIRDLLNAIRYLMQNESKGVFNIATKDVLTQKEVVLEVLKHFPALEPTYVEKPKYLEIASQSMVCSVPYWKPTYTFSQGIGEAIEKFEYYYEDWA